MKFRALGLAGIAVGVIVFLDTGMSALALLYVIASYAIVLGVVVYEKFFAGAYLVVILVPVLVGMMLFIHSQYARSKGELAVAPDLGSLWTLLFGNVQLRTSPVMQVARAEPFSSSVWTDDYTSLLPILDLPLPWQ
jgi:hypothetical protein